MIKDITIGQFFPGNSVIHRMDPRMKIILTIYYIVLLFCIGNFWGFALMAALMVAVILISKIPVSIVLKSIRPLLFIIAFTAFFNVFNGDGQIIFPEVSFLGWLTWGGVANAAFMIVRIILLIVGTSFMTYTTSPVMLTDAIEKLLMPLRIFKLPVHELAMMMTIAMRFIPTLIDEAEKIMNAQKARGADFETGNIVRRAKALIPILIPLIVSAFRRAEELADAMECRCYNGESGRTRYKEYGFTFKDCVSFGIFVLITAAVIFLNVLF